MMVAARFLSVDGNGHQGKRVVGDWRHKEWEEAPRP